MSTSFRVIVVGLGIQGYKRRRFAGADVVAAVDPFHAEAQYKSVEDVPLSDFDAALVCTPDEPKFDLLSYLLGNGKHVLVEKPLWTPKLDDIHALQSVARTNNVVCYTAYNHRFEPHFVTMRNLIGSGTLGEIYSVRMSYGNGTARLVRESVWRDQGAGVLPDLGSHLLDTCRHWFGVHGFTPSPDDFTLRSARAFENRSADYCVIGSETSRPRIELEMTLLMWRNHFTCDVLAEKGTAHIASLCKWGPSTFTHRKRILPSGRPPETAVTLVQDDPTWEIEYAHFRTLCLSGAATDLSGDAWLFDTLTRLGTRVQKECRP